MKKYLFLVAVLVVALVVPASSVAAEDTTLVPYKLSGWFVADAKPGSDPFWDQLESGSFSGTYHVPEGAFPANSGTSFEIFEFEISLRAVNT